MNNYRDKEGRFKTPVSQVSSRLGVEVTNKYGTKAKVIEYINATEVLIEYENGIKQKTTWRDFYVIKEFHSPLCKTVCNIGYFGEGCYTHDHPSKDMWTQMIHRVYNNKKLKLKPTYKECSVCDEWHNFQNFAKWYDENYYEVDGCQMHIDKDILVKNNKVYAPDKCLIVPLPINSLVVRGQKNRGDYPIGVTLRKDNGKLRVHFTKSFYNGQKIKAKRFSFGQYEDVDEAFQIYKIEKEKYIQEVADHYKNQIPEKLYNALYNYQVEITD